MNEFAQNFLEFNEVLHLKDVVIDGSQRRRQCKVKRVFVGFLSLLVMQFDDSKNGR